MHKVVVTGVGALAPNGNSAEQFWSAIESGTSGIALLHILMLLIIEFQ